jgi:coenzyme F420-0:L-glutamate ligase/coenzyme F420-1:gamma-L-glutamate ligase
MVQQRETRRVSLHALNGLPLVQPGDDLISLIVAAIGAAGQTLDGGDIVVVAQKIVSKAEGLYVNLDDVTPTAEAIDLAARTGKDPRHVQTILSESSEIIRVGPQLIITAHRLGFVMANAGIDESNIEHRGSGRLLLLPRDPDGSAKALKNGLDKAFDVECGVIINDSFGRPWRNGVVGVALGAAGVPSLVDRVGSEDLFGRKLKVTEVATADELASAASLLMGQGDEGVPAVLIKGFASDAPERPASALLRSRERDLFR